MPNSGPWITTSAVEQAARLAEQFVLLPRGDGWEVASILVGKDVTAEGLLASGQDAVDLSFFGRTAGPGPRLTIWTRLIAMGLQDEELAIHDDVERMGLPKEVLSTSGLASWSTSSFGSRRP